MSLNHQIVLDLIFKKIFFLRKKLSDLVKDINKINELGRDALVNQFKIPHFMAAFSAAKSFQQNFNKIWDDLLEVHCIMDTDSNFPTDEDNKLQASFQRQYFEVLTTYNKLVRKSTGRAVTPQLDPSTSSVTLESDTLHIIIDRIHKDDSLLEAGLEEFSGDAKEWLHFRRKFMAKVHEEGKLSKIEKFSRLLQSLTGEPLFLIKSIPFREENYDRAWETIKEMYDNPYKLASAYLSNILDLEPTTNHQSNEALQELLKILQENDIDIQNMKLNNCKEFMSHKAEIHYLESNIKQTSKTECQDLALGDCSELGVFVRECSKIWETSNNINENMEQKYSNRTISSCFVCQKKHHVLKCPSYLNSSVEDRYRLLQKIDNVCINCLQSGHQQAKCKSFKNCGICQAKHHTTLCTQELPVQSLLAKDSSSTL